MDSKSIAISMIKQANKDNSKKLCEFIVSRTAVGRGGEHMPLLWNKGTYEYYFMAPDLEWSIIKQTSQQCMLFFSDL